MSEAGDKSSVEGEDEIDRLLASLTAAEVEELENELMDIDPDPAVPAGLRQRNQTEKKPSVQYNREAMLDFCEQETRRLIQRELSFEVWRLSFFEFRFQVVFEFSVFKGLGHQ